MFSRSETSVLCEARSAWIFDIKDEDEDEEDAWCDIDEDCWGWRLVKVALEGVEGLDEVESDGEEGESDSFVGVE